MEVNRGRGGRLKETERRLRRTEKGKNRDRMVIYKARRLGQKKYDAATAFRPEFWRKVRNIRLTADRPGNG